MTPKKSKELRCVLYARYSTDKQRAESLDDQWHICAQVAAREGFKVVERFGDKEISGGTDQRPGYQAMLRAARDHKFDCIIVEDISRLWRNRAEFGPRSAELEDLKVHMVTAVGDDTRRDGWGLTIQIKLAMAEHQRREASYRTRRGLDGLARAGKPTGGKAYGYLMKDRQRTINAEQAKVVLQMYKWRAAGWSGQRIARQLNADKVPPPGASWNRKDTGPNRKNTAKGWRSSAIVGDPSRGVGILNNPLYKGELVWGRSKWTRSAADSNDRTPEIVEQTEWVVTKDESLRIVPTELWDKVRAMQTETNPRREAVRKGIASKASGHGSKYWLGTLLVCAECGSNYIGDGRRDYVCPAFTAGHCTNNLRFRRDDAHVAAFDLLRRELLNDDAIERGRVRVESWLEEQARHEDATDRAAADDAQMRALNDELANLRKMNLRPAALAAAIEEIEKEKAALVAKASGRKGQQQGRARQLLAKLPEIVKAHKVAIQNALKVLARPDVVDDARSITRRLLEDGRITLAPDANRSVVSGPMRLKELGQHVLELAGFQRGLRLTEQSVSPVVAGAGFEPATFGL
jgi:site-specific DNA recombinase